MYLINALSFDAQWQSIYTTSQIRDGKFTTQDGQTRDAQFMYSGEHRYLNDGLAQGFIKYYADAQYAFAALLPNEGLSVEDYVASLSGAGLVDMLCGAQSVQVRAAIPKFECEYSVEMSEILKDMGMTDAFDPMSADFTGLGSYNGGKENIFINRVLHKTFIAVDERGTRAGAATAVEMAATAAAPIQEPKTVYLDRPFVYMLIDCENNVPIFIGTAMDI